MAGRTGEYTGEVTVKATDKCNGEGWLPSPFFLAGAMSQDLAAAFQERTGTVAAGVAGAAGTAGAEGAADVAGCGAGVFSAGCVGADDAVSGVPPVCGAGAVAGVVTAAGVAVAGVSH